MSQGSNAETSQRNALKRKQRPIRKRGVNQCKRVGDLKEGEKLSVTYYNNGPVGESQTDLARHIGRLVRDRNICPIRVHKWHEIDEAAKENIWTLVRVSE